MFTHTCLFVLRFFPLQFLQHLAAPWLPDCCIQWLLTCCLFGTFFEICITNAFGHGFIGFLRAFSLTTATICLRRRRICIAVVTVSIAMSHVKRSCKKIDRFLSIVFFCCECSYPSFHKSSFAASASPDYEKMHDWEHAQRLSQHDIVRLCQRVGKCWENGSISATLYVTVCFAVF